MTKFFPRVLLSIICLYFPGSLAAMEDKPVVDHAARGESLFFARASCWVCHGKNAEGLVGPSLRYGPSPALILQKLNSVPQMGAIKAELNLTTDDLLGIATYLYGLEERTAGLDQIAEWRGELTQLEALNVKKIHVPLSARDKKILEIQTFDSVLADWTRHAKPGSLKRDYEVRTIAEYEPAAPVFTPKPGGLYFYQNTGTSAGRAPKGAQRATTTQVVVGDAVEKRVITVGKIPSELRGAVHTTVMSPDGRYVYIIGPNERGAEGLSGKGALRSSATMLKVDALTLQPVKQMAVGGRIHHGQIFKDSYILFDTFNSDPDGLDVFLFDPTKDSIVGGISTVDLGGSAYTAFTDNQFIYVLMQPGSDGGMLLNAQRVASGRHVADLPYWVAKIDPANWEVVAEYPFPGYRGDWITIDAAKENLYIPAGGSSNVSKLDNATGEVLWSAATGTGPYGATLNADETELWVSNKGESTGMIGRTITVIDTETGRGLETLFSGYQSDHVLLAPSGKEMWSTSNGEGRINVFDAHTKEKIAVIDMPEFGDPHGLVWVKYDSEGNARVVRDQGGFHNGVNPHQGRALPGQ